jgi:cell division protein FtsA
MIKMSKSSSNDIITGLDIGSTSVRVAVGQRTSGGLGRESIQIIGAAETPSVGVNKGVITSIEDAISSVSTCLEKVERMTGVQIERGFIGISGHHIVSQESKGVVAVSRSDGEIREEDVDRALEAARTVATPLNYEILHVLPKSFIVDGQTGIKDPVGMTGIRLEVDAQIIQSLSSQLKNLTKCVYRTGIEIDDVVLGILAASEAVASSRQKELGVAVANIGGSTTSLVVYEDGDVMRTVVLPIGSQHITSDVAIGLRTSIEVAERVKVEHGIASTREVKKEDIRLADLGAEEDEVVSKRDVAEIIEARVEEIFSKIDKELKKIDRSGRLPAGIILTGGGSKLSGLVEMAKGELRLPAALGYPVNVSSITDRTNDIAFSTTVGLVLWGHHLSANDRGKGKGNPLGRFQIGSKLKNLVRSLLP